MQLGALSEGRVKLCLVSSFGVLVSARVPIIFGSVRRQFWRTKYDESRLIDYPSWQARVFPYYAESVIMMFCGRTLNNLWRDNKQSVFDTKNKEVKEMHALISAAKPVTAWLLTRGLQEFREACGGLGISAYSKLPQMIAG